MEFGELIDEAFEQAGIDPASITARHLNSATRSLMLLYTEIENAGAKPEYRVEANSITLDAGQGAVLLPSDTIDVMEVSFSSAGSTPSDTNLVRSHRQEWLQSTRRDEIGRPMSFWVSKSRPTETGLIGAPQAYGWGQGAFGSGTFGGATTATEDATDNQRLLVLWPANETDGATITMNRIRWHAQPSTLATHLDTARNWLDTVAVGLATRLAGKWNEDRYARLKSDFDMKLARRVQDEDRGPVFIGFRAHGFSRRRRH